MMRFFFFFLISLPPIKIKIRFENPTDLLKKKKKIDELLILSFWYCSSKRFVFYFFVRRSSTVRNAFPDCKIITWYFIPSRIFKNSCVANFFCASSLLLRTCTKACKIHRNAPSSFASGMMKEKASTTGSELRILLEEGLLARILLMEVAIHFASSDVFE